MQTSSNADPFFSYTKNGPIHRPESMFFTNTKKLMSLKPFIKLMKSGKHVAGSIILTRNHIYLQPARGTGKPFDPSQKNSFSLSLFFTHSEQFRVAPGRSSINTNMTFHMVF